MMKTMDEALKLKNIMEKVGKFYNRETICEITDMIFLLDLTLAMLLK